MVKKYILLIALTTLPVLAVATSHVNAQSNTTSSSSESIWNGLWNGINFDLQSLDLRSKPDTSTPPSQLPATKRVTSAASSPAQVAPSQPKATYAALGDSVAAGLGLSSNTVAGTTDSRCGRSTESYVYAVATAKNLNLNHIACSGATVGDMFTKQRISGPNIAAQLDTAFAGGTPALITFTAGANDAHWNEFIRACYASRCANSVTTGIANGYLIALQAKLYVAFNSIYLRSQGSPPPVVVTGYYNPLSPSCTSLQNNIKADEITWLAAETAALNQTIQDVSAQYSFVQFAPVDFTGHDICSNDPWIQGISDAAPFHPTATGQKVFANAVVAATKGY